MDLSAALPFGSAWVALVLLLTLRLAGTFAASPLLARTGVPASARIFVALGLAAALSLALPLPALPARVLDAPGLLFVSALSELALGAAMGLGVQLAFAGISIAGRVLDVQLGFGLVQVFDPMSGAKASILSSAFDQLAILAFFLLNVHHVLLRGFAWSLERYPVGQLWPVSAGLLPLMKQVSASFALGLALAAPIVFCILLVELALGVIAHALPQMNMLMIGLPVKVVVGMLALALWAPWMEGMLNRLYRSIYTTWNAMLVAQAPVQEWPHG